MSRTFVIWSVFSAALVLVLAVMMYLTVRMVQFENAAAVADARAATEERIRLALWRMDSTAAALLAEKPRRPISSNATANAFNNVNGTTANNSAAQNSELRVALQFQQQLSLNEYQQRAALSPPTANNWGEIEPLLLDRISDILEGAKLEPIATSAGGADDTRRLASIPARLIVPPAAFVAPPLPFNTPLRISLMIAWICTLVAAFAVALLLGGALSLGERRGAFVSAVTHELRTPLTTFRMYSEMLACNMVADPKDRQQYLDTLVSESDRLGHLIENVLAYARVERRLSPARAQRVILGDLLDRTLPTLLRRAEQAALPFVADVPAGLPGMELRTDAIAVQQILLNLVDNACKYGQARIKFSVFQDGGHLEFRVADEGAGLSAKEAKKLFSAFSKRQTDAIPGIGLGLFLSRRLARALSGDLRYIQSTRGAVFALRLPIISTARDQG